MLLRLIVVFSFVVGAATRSLAQERSDLTIKSGDTTHSFSIEMADTPELIEQGLMERTELAADAGMLFNFGAPTQTAMWMKNTPLALDMLFIDASGKVVAIAHNTVPNSERRIGTGSPVKAVLELNAGTAKGLGIKPGASIHHSIFANEIDAIEAGE